jgi:hypothetical protein
MADFCNKCAEEHFGEVDPDIDVMKIYEELEPGFSSSGYLCEGCGLIAVARMEDNTLKVMRIPLDENEETLVKWEEY